MVVVVAAKMSPTLSLLLLLLLLLLLRRKGTQYSSKGVRNNRTATRAPYSVTTFADSSQQILRDTTKKLRDCVKRKAPSSAIELLVSLGRDHGIEPDARAASTCIAACIAGRDLDMAEKVFSSRCLKAACASQMKSPSSSS